MKLLRLLLPALAILATGCLKLEETFTIRPDGSADLDLVYSISEPAVTQMKALLKVRDQMAALSGDTTVSPDPYSKIFLNPAEEQLRRELKKYEKFGLSIERLKVDTRDGWRQVQVRVRCKNLADLAKTDIFRTYGFSLTKDPEANYVLFRDRESAGDASTDVPDPETLKLMTPVLDGFKIVLKINTPGRIIKANSHLRSTHGATWEYDFNRNPNAINQLQDQQFNVVFQGRTAEGKSLSLPEISQKPPARP